MDFSLLSILITIELIIYSVGIYAKVIVINKSDDMVCMFTYRERYNRCASELTSIMMVVMF